MKIADSYFDAIEHSDGNLVPFADDGFRIENGVRTCNNPRAAARPDRDPVWQKLSAMTCRQGLSSHVFSYIKSIQPRRYEVVDVEHGVVFADPVFNHPGTVLTVDSPELGKFNMTRSDWASHPTSALITEPDAARLVSLHDERRCPLLGQLLLQKTLAARIGELAGYASIRISGLRNVYLELDLGLLS